MTPKHLGFHHRNDGLWCDEVRLADIAQSFETPCYVYSTNRLHFQLDLFSSAFRGMNILPCYAAKANNNPEILRQIAACSSLQWGMDAVSGGELKAGLACGFSPDRMIFSGVGKKDAEILFAVEHDIALNVESLFELESIIAIARSRSKRARIGLRVNPDVDAHTHPKITTGKKKNKFGLSGFMIELALKRISETGDFIRLSGVSAHIGSQITDVSAWRIAADHLVRLADSIHESGREDLEFIDFGGGFPVRYEGDPEPPGIEQFANAIKGAQASARLASTRNLRIIVEPGRWVVAECGGLLTRVIGVKDQFVVVDASMTELIRPALYDARHEIILEGHQEQAGKGACFDVVGPVCESSDVLAYDIRFNDSPKKNQLAVILQAGAYGFTMASNYNLRPMPAELVVKHDLFAVTRHRQCL